MGELREARLRAARELDTAGWDAMGHGDWCEDCRAFRGEQLARVDRVLRSLEESGWKLVGPEPTPGMVRAAHAAKIFLNMTDAGWVAAHRAMLAAAPTVAELLEEKKG